MSYRLLARPKALVCSHVVQKQNVLEWRKKPVRSDISPGVLSTNARRKMKTAIRWLLAASSTKMVYEKRFKKKVPWKINMITFTFHENMQDDKLARQILSKWLEMAKYRFNLCHYVWKAEPQQRGAIHFHLITNVYIPHQELRYTWNRLLRKYNLNNISDNSTDVHAVVNVKNVEAYLTEYMMNDKKHEGRRKISGKLWSASHGLSTAGKKSIYIDDEEATAIKCELSEYSLENIIMREGKPIPKFLDFTSYFILPKDWYQKLPDCELKHLYFDQLQLLKDKQQRQLFPELVEN